MSDETVDLVMTVKIHYTARKKFYGEVESVREMADIDEDNAYDQPSSIMELMDMAFEKNENNVHISVDPA